MSEIFYILLAASVLTPVLFLLADIRRRPTHIVVLSPFWYFTLIWAAAFPLRAWLIEAGHVFPQVALKGIDTGWATNYGAQWLSISLAVAVVFWAATYIGYRRVSPHTSTVPISSQTHSSVSLRPGMVLIALFVLSALTIWHLNPTTSTLDSSNYQKARMGAGHLWILPELFSFAVLAYIAYVLPRAKNQIRSFEMVLLALGFGAALWFSMELFSRRLVASMLLGYIVLAVLRHTRLWPLGLFAVLGSVFASGAMELIRRIPRVLEGQDHFAWDTFRHAFEKVLLENHLAFVSTSFEGAEHLARYLDKATWLEIVSGIDHGLSWMFNMGLSLVPRAIWTSKPVIYGGLEQLHWLYPKMFRGEFAATALPTSYIVDFSFAFGLPVGLIVAYYLGRFLKVCEIQLWSPTVPVLAKGIALLTFIYMFNVVRGGSAIGLSIVLFSGVAVSMFGIGDAWNGLWSMVRDTFTNSSSYDARVRGKIFFYPHAYLRDRQLDTVRQWPHEDTINAQALLLRPGAQVSREQSLSPAKTSWKRRLPLVNVKRRPQGSPQDATIYVWGGLMASGSYITDIDNPYAFTAYNVTAARLYRPIIRAFLESPRCLQIRCLSQACLDGVRREYGDIAAQKAVVVYPVIAPKVDRPRPQSAETCRFLFVSTQFEIKGGKALLSAFEKVASVAPHAQLDIVTHLPERYRPVVERLPNLHLHPAQFTRDEIAERFLCKSDVLVHPTYFDSFGMIVLEAMACGMSIIATDVYALSELVVPDHNGLLLCPPLSIWHGTEPSSFFSDTQWVAKEAASMNDAAFVESLADAMIKMATNPAFRERAAQASLELLHTRFEKPS